MQLFFARFVRLLKRRSKSVQEDCIIELRYIYIYVYVYVICICICICIYIYIFKNHVNHVQNFVLTFLKQGLLVTVWQKQDSGARI